MATDTLPLAELRAAPRDMMLISSSWTPEAHFTQQLSSALWRWARAGVALGGIDTGAFLLAEAGLLEGRRERCITSIWTPLVSVSPTAR